MKAVLLKLFQLDTEPKPWYETVQVDPLEEPAMRELEIQGFSVDILSGSNPLLDVGVPGSEPISTEQLENLLQARNQLTWLNLAGKGLQDDQLSILAQFPNLTRLRLQNNPITDAGVAHLQGLSHLESLNLYGTQITDEALQYIRNMPALQNLYLWQTKVSKEAVAQLQNDLPELEVDMGIEVAGGE